MPIHGYPGNIITANPTAPSVSSASGVWTTEQQLQNMTAGNWPMAATQISRSLRFNSADVAYLNRTPASAGNLKTWTISLWVKLGVLDTNRVLFSAISGSNEHTLYFNSSNIIDWYDYPGSYVGRLQTTQVFRDPSSWYHIVATWDSSNRMRLYVNGSEVTTFNIDTNPPLNTDSIWNTAIQHRLGGYAYSNITWNGLATEINFIDGLALTPASFGQTNPATGVWEPRQYTGPYGTNGFYLNFSDNSGTTSTTLGKDYSGRGNNWTPNNFSVTAGAGNDSLLDTPTPYGTDTGAGGEVRGNYCTANPLDIYPKSGTWTVSNGNLDLSLSGAVWDAIRGTTGVTSGKWYWEITATGINNTNSYAMVGIQKGAGGNWQDPFAYVYYSLNGQKYNNGSGAAYGNSWTTNDVIGVAFDADAGEIKFYKNNTVQNSGTAAFTGLTSGPYTPVIMLNGTGSAATVTCNFGQRPFAYTAPSGFKALCTTNLPTPTIGATATTRADDYFDIALYTASGFVNTTVSSLGFQPDLVWLKARDAAFDNGLYDAVRGVQKELISNTTAAETTQSTGITAFNSNGYSVGTRFSSASYASWCWKANGAGSSNTQGTITSTVSANTTAGFSIVTYTGTGANATVGHGLGVAPSMIIIKNRTGSGVSSGWGVYHTSIGNTKYLALEQTAAAGTSSALWNNTSPTSTVFSLGNEQWVNTNGGSHVAYCFAPVAGYSAFGSYTGNGSTDGPFIYTGFRPAWIMIKISSSTSGWYIFDVKRNTYNALTSILAANTSGAEATDPGYAYDFVSNGFKLRNSGGSFNLNGDTYIYAAFAEFPFKYTLAR